MKNEVVGAVPIDFTINFFNLFLFFEMSHVLAQNSKNLFKERHSYVDDFSYSMHNAYQQGQKNHLVCMVIKSQTTYRIEMPCIRKIFLSA
jgi:hypothetical protein